MKTYKVVETAKELFDCAKGRRQCNEEKVIFSNTKLIFENKNMTIRLEGVHGYELSDKITLEDILTEALGRLNIGVHIT